MGSSLHLIDVDWNMRNIFYAQDGTERALVSPETLAKFSSELQARKKRRDKTRKERYKTNKNHKLSTPRTLKDQHDAMMKELQQQHMLPIQPEPMMWDLDDTSAWPSSSQHPPRSPLPQNDDPNSTLSSSLPSYAQIATTNKSPQQALLSLSNPDEWPSMSSTSHSSSGPQSHTMSHSPGTFSFAKILDRSGPKPQPQTPTISANKR